MLLEGLNHICELHSDGAIGEHLDVVDHEEHRGGAEVREEVGELLEGEGGGVGVLREVG